MSIPQVTGSISTPLQSLSSSNSLAGGSVSAQVLFLNTKISKLSLTRPSNIPLETRTIRMGGGPRTYPGGVTKWQWKRMQAKKAKQLLQARLARERQIYEMRKRAELKAAVSELERPWERIEKPPTLFSTSVDEQLKVLADRFQRPGGFDLWSERDGPELFRPDNGLPSTRFFPKGVVHSVKPYGRVAKTSDGFDEFGSLSSEDDTGASGTGGKAGFQRSGNYGNSKRRLKSEYEKGSNGVDFVSSSEAVTQEYQNTAVSNERSVNKGYSRKPLNDSKVRFQSSRRNGRLDTGSGDFGRRYVHGKREDSNSEVYDMNKQNGGSYGSKRRLKSEYEKGSNGVDFGSSSEDATQEYQNMKISNERSVSKGYSRKSLNDSKVRFQSSRRNNRLDTGSGDFGRRYVHGKREDSNSGLYDMNKKNGGSYGSKMRLKSEYGKGSNGVDYGWSSEDVTQEYQNTKILNGRSVNKGYSRKPFNDSKVRFQSNRRSDRLDTGSGDFGRRYVHGKREDSNSGVYDMDNQNDGSYGFELDI